MENHIRDIKKNICRSEVKLPVVSDSFQPHGHQASLSVGFSRQEYWSGLPYPSPRNLPDPGIEPRTPTLPADSLPAEPQGKPKNIGVGSLSLLQQIFPTQESDQGLLGFFTNWAIREAHPVVLRNTKSTYSVNKSWSCPKLGKKETILENLELEIQIFLKIWKELNMIAWRVENVEKNEKLVSELLGCLKLFTYIYIYIWFWWWWFSH